MKKITLFLFGLICSVSANVLFAEDSNSQRESSDAELEQMLAPIALYPDTVLTHILIASTYPLEIVQANRWVSKHPDMEPGEALENVESKEWDPSVKALIPFPKILERLSDDLDWTQQLGDAFLQNEERMLDSIQSLRRKADRAGNLDKMEHMEITREDDGIIIQPVEKEIVYVPYYDTRVVYGPWHWIHYPPVYWDRYWDPHHHYSHHSPFFWYPGIHIPFGFFFSAFHWHNHHVVVIDHHDHYSRRYYHRRHIIHDSNARRWRHNPVHRRGVSYRTESIRHRYHSSRPSVSQIRKTRRNERTPVSPRTPNISRKTSRKSVNADQPRITRQDRLREQLNVGRVRKPRKSAARNNNVLGDTGTTNSNSRNRRNVQGSNNVRSQNSNPRASSTNERRTIRTESSKARRELRKIKRDKRNQQSSSEHHRSSSRSPQRVEPRYKKPTVKQMSPRRESFSKSNYREAERHSNHDSRKSESNRRNSSSRSSRRKEH